MPRQPAPRLLLPPLDVAAFVGFAERGPLDVPVMLEDINTYEKVFGGDIPLAQEAGGQVVYANLSRAVQAFFANRGRRCYVVRVAGKRAEAARFRMPGVVALEGASGPRLAAVSASSPGAWGARLRLATRLAVNPLPATAFAWTQIAGDKVALQMDGGVLHLAGGSAVRVGDVLRLRLSDGSCWLAPVDAVERPSAPDALFNPAKEPPTTLHLKRFYRLVERLETSPPEQVEQLDLITIDGPVALVSSGGLQMNQEQTVLALHRDDWSSLSAGDILRVHLSNRPAGDLGYLARIEEIRVSEESVASPPGPAFEVAFSELLQLSEENLPLDPLSNPQRIVSIQTVELLRLELLVRLSDEQLPVIGDLSFNYGQGPPQGAQSRFWGEAVLLDSSLANGRQTQARRASPYSGAPTDRQTNPHGEAAEWFRRLVADPYDILPLAGERSAQQQKALNFSPKAALAGVLAPTGSDLGVTREEAQTSFGYDQALEELSLLTYLPLGLPEILTEGDPGQFLPPEAGRAGDDDLQTFEAGHFCDARLAPPGTPGALGPGESHRTLMQTAFDLHYLQGRRLRGLHSLLFIDEIGLVSTPDAPHYRWEKGVSVPQVVPAKPPPPAAEPDCPPKTGFANCNRPPAILEVKPHFGPLDKETLVSVRGEFFASGANVRLFFGRGRAEIVAVVSSTELIVNAPPGVRLGPVDVTVENENGSALLAGGFTYTQASTTPHLPVVTNHLEVRSPPGSSDVVDDEPFLTIHEALAIFCQARGDVVSVLSLPADYDTVRCLEWQQALRRRLRLPVLDTISAFEEPLDIADLSFVTVYHPWLLSFDRQSADRMRRMPPDGAVCGLIAARERERQVWVAPANQPLVEVIGLQTTLTDDDWAELFARRFNLVRLEAEDFRPMSAHTLSGERSLMQLSVRRLMILLRKAAMQLGIDFVFETNHEVFREGVRGVIEELLHFLFENGAFAGRTEAELFRVITDKSVNPQESVDQGRFVAVIQVAPSQPMEFITVQLSRTGEGTLLAVEA